MKYHALFVIFEIAVKFEIVVCLQILGGALWASYDATVQSLYNTIQKVLFRNEGHRPIIQNSHNTV